MVYSKMYPDGSLPPHHIVIKMYHEHPAISAFTDCKKSNRLDVNSQASKKLDGCMVDLKKKNK